MGSGKSKKYCKVLFNKLFFVGVGLGMSVTIDVESAKANTVNDYVKEGITKKGWVSPKEQDRLGQIKYQNNYATGFAKPTKIINHETANDGSTIEGEISYMIRNQENAFVHAFIDANNIISIASTDYLSWGSGPKGNATGIQVEQVRVNSKDDFAKEIMNLATYNVAMLKQYGLTPSLGQKNGTGSIWTHAMVTYYLGGTNHVDPDGYWADRASKYFNTTYTINNFTELVTDMYYGKIVSQSPAEVSTTTTIKQEGSNFIAEVTVAGATDRITKIQVPTWNAANNQKDLRWYTATKINANTYRAVIPIQNHKLAGTYLFHTYAGADDGTFKVKNHNSLVYQAPKVTVNTTHQIVNGKLVIQSNVSGEVSRISKMQVPIWRGNAGGNSAIWYTMTKKSNNLYEYVYDGLKNSNYNKVNTHVYATFDDWQLKNISTNSFEFSTPNITGETSVQLNGAFAELTTQITGDTSRIDYVQFPTWSQSNPSKVKWYRAKKVNETMYTATIPLADFDKKEGQYTTHSYIKTTEGKDQLYKGTSFTYEDKINLATETSHQIVNGKLVIQTKVTGDTNRIQKLQVPIWRGNAGGNSATWYTMTKKSNNLYEYVYDGLKNSDYNKVHTHVYATFDNSQMKCISTNGFEFSKPNITGSTTAQLKGDFIELSTTITGETSRINYVQFPTWNQSNPNKVKWYRAKKVNETTYTATIPLADFDKKEGTYITHSYIKTAEGKDQLYSSASLNTKKPKIEAINTVEVNDNVAVITTTLSGDVQYVEKVTHPSWSTKNSNAKMWHDAEKQNETTWKSEIPLTDFQEYGDYKTQTYLTIEEDQQNYGNVLNYRFNPAVVAPNTTITVVDNIATVRTEITGDIDRITKVEFPTWHTTNEQKDLFWYEATKVAENIWEAKIDLTQHNIAGEYATDTYITVDEFSRENYMSKTFTWDKK